MKNIFYIIPLLFLFINCSKNSFEENPVEKVWKDPNIEMEKLKEELLNQNGESAADLVFELGKAFGVKLFENDVLYPQLHPGAVNTRLSRMVLREQFIGLEICAVYFPHGFTVEQTGLAIRARSQEATQFVRSFLAGKISIKGE